MNLITTLKHPTSTRRQARVKEIVVFDWNIDADKRFGAVYTVWKGPLFMFGLFYPIFK